MPENTPILFVIHVAGAAALLIWAVRLVRTGVERGWSVQLRRWLRRGNENRLLAAAAGTGATMVLQSSTAVAVLVANFAAAGTLTGEAGTAVMLGSFLGSAIVTQILVTPATWLVPVLLLAGVTIFQRSQQREWRMAGRSLIGLGLIFVALGMMLAATEPLAKAQGLTAVMAYLGGDPVTAFAIGAVFTWAVQSSVTSVLLVVTLAQTGVMPVAAGAAMVLGANLGSSMNGLTLTLGSGLEARRMILANLAVRGGGAAVALLTLALARPSFDALGPTPARQVLNLHLLFNLALLVLALPVTGPLMRAARRLVAAPAVATRLDRVSALDPATLDQPARALSAATREILVMGEGVEAMLRAIMGLYRTWDESAADAIRLKEEDVDRIHLETKLFLARLQRTNLDETSERRVLGLAEMGANLESAANVIAQSMLPLARRLDQEGVTFSETGFAEVNDFHDRVLANAQAALNVVMTLNPDAARALVAEKDQVR
ncbi:MAG: Na/Pi cotransporter family protein, partial [Proteobacteria bacterium]|nr:Na/Pi cotransporter family protein [Pseudomonadota bacterium]